MSEEIHPRDEKEKLFVVPSESFLCQGFAGRWVHARQDGGGDDLGQVRAYQPLNISQIPQPTATVSHLRNLTRHWMTIKHNWVLTCSREALMVMPDHTTAVRGVVLNDQFVRWRNRRSFKLIFINVTFWPFFSSFEILCNWEQFL